MNRCGDCKFFVAHDRIKNDPGARINECRINPPTHAGWPKVRLSDGCGHFKAARAADGDYLRSIASAGNPSVLQGARALVIAALLILCAAPAMAEGGPDSIYVPGVGYQDAAYSAPQIFAPRSARAVDPQIHAMVTQAALAAGVPANVAHAVIRQESGYKPRALGDRGASYGLGQIKCATARGEGFTGPCRDLFDPAINLRYSMRYLRKALDKGSVAYYNAGIHAKRVPHAARRYASAVMGRAQ